MSTTAGTLVNNVRDEIPDPTPSYGDATQDGGLIRAATMYRWLDAGVRVAARECGTVIHDWTAIAQVTGTPNYTVDDAFVALSDGFSNLWPIDIITLLEGDTIWPSGKVQAQSLAGYYHVEADHLEFGLYPAPNLTDPATTLSGNISASATAFAVASVTGFLAYGYIKIGSEIMRYESITGTTLNAVTRGCGGTTAATHTGGDAVQHLGLWLKGKRVPATITSSTSVVELPRDIVMELELYLLARCRRSENEHAEARALLKEFADTCRRIAGDPTRRVQYGRAREYGEPTVGPVYFPRISGGVIFS